MSELWKTYFIFLALLLLAGCGPKSWYPADDNADNYPFYTPIVGDFRGADGTLLQVAGGLVEIFECNSTQARIGSSIWIDRSLLEIDWCDHFVAKYHERYARMKP
jgi:hypothetical protein